MEYSNNSNNSNALDLLKKMKSGELSNEKVAEILMQNTSLAFEIVNIIKEDAKQHKELSEDEHRSIDKLTEAIKIVWNDPNASPEVKHAQCKEIMALQEKLLKSKTMRQKRHEKRKDITNLVIGTIFVGFTLWYLSSNNTNDN